jgi:hypothetical protein
MSLREPQAWIKKKWKIKVKRKKRGKKKKEKRKPATPPACGPMRAAWCRCLRQLRALGARESGTGELWQVYRGVSSKLGTKLSQQLGVDVCVSCGLWWQ